MTLIDPSSPSSPDENVELRADCARCYGLCCAALPFEASSDFAVSKPAGAACRHLKADFRCKVHDRLRDIGYRGCTVFDCFGAGQRVSSLFGGVSWREAPESAKPMFKAFHVMRLLHELKWYLRDALSRDIANALSDGLRQHLAAAEAMASLPAQELHLSEAELLRDRVRPALHEASEWIRASSASLKECARTDDGGRSSATSSSDADPAYNRHDGGRFTAADYTRRSAAPVSEEQRTNRRAPGRSSAAGSKRGPKASRRGTRQPIGPGADLMGASLGGMNLSGVNLIGAYLIAADLSHANLRLADLIGADLRDANLSGADLRDSLFLTQFQINGAMGDVRTLLPPWLDRPSHWH